MLDAALVLMDSVGSDNASGAGNQQERLSIATIASDLGNFLAGFALGEGSFMIVCRRRADYRCGWKVSAAFNVSQNDVAPLELFRRTLGCGTIRMAGNGGWYFEVNNLRDIQAAVVPFFRQFPLVGRKQIDFELFADAVRYWRRHHSPTARVGRFLRFESRSTVVANADTPWRESSETIRRTLRVEGMR